MPLIIPHFDYKERAWGHWVPEQMQSAANSLEPSFAPVTRNLRGLKKSIAVSGRVCSSRRAVSSTPVRTLNTCREAHSTPISSHPLCQPPSIPRHSLRRHDQRQHTPSVTCWLFLPAPLYRIHAAGHTTPRSSYVGATDGALHNERPSSARDRPPQPQPMLYPFPPPTYRQEARSRGDDLPKVLIVHYCMNRPRGVRDRVHLEFLIQQLQRNRISSIQHESKLSLTSTDHEFVFANVPAHIQLHLGGVHQPCELL